MLAVAKCDVLGKSEEGFKKTDIQCEGSNCFEVQGSGKLNLAGYDSFNIKEVVGVKKENSKIYCDADGKLIRGTNFAFGTKGLSSSFSVELPVKSSGKIKIDGVNPGDSVKFDTDDLFLFIKGQDNIKDVGEAGKKDLQITPVAICGQKINAPLGKNSFFLIKVDKDSKEGCKVVSYSIWGSEFSKEMQSSSYKCGNKDLKLNGVALGNGKSFQCDIEGNIKCYTQGCFENIAGYYNLQIEGRKLQNLQGFKSYEQVKDTEFSVIKGTDVVVDFKGAGVHCYDDECFFKEKTLVYCPKSGVGKTRTGGLVFGLPGLKMFEIVAQKSDNPAISSTGCFEVKTEGRLQSLTQQELETLGIKKDTTKVKILPEIDLDREFSGDIPVKITPPKGAAVSYNINEREIDIQEKIARTKLKEDEPALGARIPMVKEVLVKPIGCTPSTNQYYVPENNLLVCLTEEAAKNIFEPICKYYEGSCLNEDEIGEAIRKHMTDLLSNPQTAPHFPIIEDTLKVTTETEPDYLVFSSGECLAGDVKCSDRYPNGLYSLEVCTFDQSNNRFYWKLAEIQSRSRFYKDRYCNTPVSSTKVGECPSNQKKFGNPIVTLCMKEDEAKKAFEPLIDKFSKAKMKECGVGRERYELPFEDPSFVCLTEDEARDLFANAERNLHLQEQEAKEKECSTGKEYDPDEKKCISERLADAKKLRQIEQEEVKQSIGEKVVPADQIQSCDQPNLGVDRCYFDYDPFIGETLYFKERCIVHKDINTPTWGFFEGYYTDINCKIKIKPKPEVTVVHDSESAREKLRGQTRRIKVKDPITEESIRFGRQVAPDLIKNKNRPAVTWQGYVNELAAGEGNLGDVISAVADENNIDRTIIKAIISKESSFNVNAVSPVGAAGLMQLMPYTAKGLGLRNIYRGDEFNGMYNQFRLGRINADTFMAFQEEYAVDLRKQIAGKSKEELALFDDRFDPEKNLNAGVSYFARAYQYNKGDLGLALVTYNAGLGYVEKNCKKTYSSCNFGSNKAIPAYVTSINNVVESGGPVLDTREKILAFVKSVPKEKFIKDLVVLNGGDKKKAFEALGRMNIEPSFVQFGTYLKDVQLDLYSDPEKQGIGKSFIIQNPQFIPQGVKITADIPRTGFIGILSGSYIVERSSTALPLWRLRDPKGNVVSGLDNKELFEIFTSQQFARGSINLPLGDEIRRFDIGSDPKTKVRYFVDKKSKEKLQLHEMAEKIQKAAVSR